MFYFTQIGMTAAFYYLSENTEDWRIIKWRYLRKCISRVRNYRHDTLAEKLEDLYRDCHLHLSDDSDPDWDDNYFPAHYIINIYDANTHSRYNFGACGVDNIYIPVSNHVLCVLDSIEDQDMNIYFENRNLYDRAKDTLEEYKSYQPICVLYISKSEMAIAAVDKYWYKDIFEQKY